MDWGPQTSSRVATFDEGFQIKATAEGVELTIWYSENARDYAVVTMPAAAVSEFIHRLQSAQSAHELMKASLAPGPLEKEQA